MGVVVINRKKTTAIEIKRPIYIWLIGVIGNNPTNPCKTDKTAIKRANNIVLDLSIESIIYQPLHRVYQKCFLVYF